MSDLKTIQPLSSTDTSYSLRDFLEKFSLPQLVKVHEGHYDEHQLTTVSSDAVYNLLSLESIETVLVEDADGEESRIPLDYLCAVERVAEEKFQQQLGIQELLRESHPAVKFVRVIQNDPNFETLLKTGDKLKIVLKKKKSSDNFLPFKKVSDKTKHLWKVPASCEAKFQALWDGEELSLSKFVKKIKLPAYVRFVDNSTEESTTEEEVKARQEKSLERRHSRPLPTGVVKLKGTLVDSFVTATTETNGVTSTFSFPKTLPISVVPVKMEALKSSLDDSDSTWKEIDEDYEDMSGFQIKASNSPHLKTPFHGDSEGSGKTMTIAELESSRQTVRCGNTYSPPPIGKVTRSKSMMEQKKGRDLLQRTVSSLELRTQPIESEEHVYEELNLRSLTADRLKSSSMPRMQRRRSDSSKDQVSEQNLNNLMQAHTLENESFHGVVETVSLQIRRTSPICNKPSARLNTFGRKEKTAESESIACNVSAPDSILENQSYSTNQLPHTSKSLSTNASFYGSEEVNLETSHALSANSLLASQSGRSSGDALPPLPTLQERCTKEGPPPLSYNRSVGEEAESKGRRGLTGDEMQVLPNTFPRKSALSDPPQRSDNTNQQTKQQSSSRSGLIRNVPTDKREAPKSRTEEDPPPPIPPRNRETQDVFCPEVTRPPKAISSGDNAKERQPVPSPRGKSRSFHGQVKGERPVVSSPHENAPSSFASCVLSASSQDESLSLASSEQGSKTTRDVTPSPEPKTKPTSQDTPQATNAESPETTFNIPQDLSTLRLPEVLQCLQALNMQHFETIFEDRQVDGSMLVCLDEEALQSFGMDRFYRLKLLRFIAGWRPCL